MSDWRKLLIACGWNNPDQCSLTEQRLAELCTKRLDAKQARIAELEEAAEKYSDNGHFPDCAVNDWTTADCNCGLAELEALLPGGGE